MSSSEWAGSLPAVLHRRALAQPDGLAFRFLADGTTEQAVDWTYRQLAEHAAAVAADLRERRARRVVVALDPGLPYLAALFGALQAGVTAVPAFPPSGRRALDRFAGIVRDCRPDLVLTEPRLGHKIEQLGLGVPCLPPGADDRAPTGELTPTPAEPALLQYTSGSTAEPKGILLSHRNLVSNCEVLHDAIGVEPDRVGCSWLPPYHDMGLMGTILLAVHGGWPLVMMSPAHFVQHPYRWLKAVTDNRVTISVGPNFAFDLAAVTVEDDELATLDLSTLRQLFCGSEPVLRSTLDRFRDRFAPVGYAETALIPCYGLAEATLYVAGKRAGTPVRSARLDPAALERGRVRPVDAGSPVVSCGPVAAGHELAIVDPASGRRAGPDRIGEIWVHGPNVAEGYLDEPALTERTFGARLDGRTWLRTGDLGFLRDGELYVTGRIKDVIVVAGRNLYPQDIERTVGEAHALLRRSVAFGIRAEDPDSGSTGDGSEEVVVVAEYRGTAGDVATDGDGVPRSVVAAVTSRHGVRPHEVLLVPVGAIPTTTSGKVRRSAARAAYLAGRLPVLGGTAARAESR